MPACEPWCPLVKIQLKKLAKEAPWILKKEAFGERAGRAERVAAAGKEIDIYDGDLDEVEQFVDAQTGLIDVDARTTALRRLDAPPGLKDVDDRTALRRSDAPPGLKDVDDRTALRRLDAPPGFKDVDGRPGLRDVDTETEEARRAREEIATQWSAARGARDQLVETDAVDRVTRRVGEPGRMDVALEADAAAEAEAAAEVEAAAEAAAKVDAAAAAEDEEDVEGVDKRMFPDECDPRCPRRISRRERLRRLEERQRIVDNYLLNKGFGYFDDVCTCSLSCVIRALRDDTFVRSILASALLFTLGLKLCEELDAWYMPIRSS